MHRLLSELLNSHLRSLTDNPLTVFLENNMHVTAMNFPRADHVFIIYHVNGMKMLKIFSYGKSTINLLTLRF